MTVTSHDVARLAGVSQPTVSRALRDQPGVSPEVRARVREAARSLRYVPSHAGRSLSTQSTRRVGVVSSELHNPFYTTLLEPLHRALARSGYPIVLFTEGGEESDGLEQLIDGSLDGVVLTTTELDSTVPEELDRRGLPYVMLNRVMPNVKGDTCTFDNLLVGRMAADFLVGLGHTRIGAVHGPERTSTGRDRADGFHARLAELGVPVPDRYIRRGAFTEQAGRAAATEILSSDIVPTAIFCGNDMMALGVFNATHLAGLSVPRDLTLVGVDDIPMASWAAFDLTTIRIDLELLTETAASLLVARISDPRAEPKAVVLQPELIERGTHAPPRAP